MGKSGFIEGLWNGMKVEFGKVYSNPFVNAFKSINEADETKKLRVFDFDDTLVKTKSHIYITHGDGKKSKLTPGEYAIYEPKDGDKYDFSDFEQVKQPQEIKGVTKLLKTVARAEGERKVVILTARSAYKPVKDYLKDIGLDGIYVVALADADPQKKADWIEDKIKKGYNDVFFIDDSHKNVNAVSKLKDKYPNIKMKVSHVKHDIPEPPKQSDTAMKKDKEVSKKETPKGNDMSLKSLLPKDLDKKVKNPDTGKMIKVSSALKYDKDTKAFKAAQFALKKK
jgi:predicted DNA-binding antitoxin AbrB/MazE fold protein